MFVAIVILNLQIIAGSISFSFLKTNRIGGFWGGIPAILVGLIALSSANRYSIEFRWKFSNNVLGALFGVDYLVFALQV